MGIDVFASDKSMLAFGAIQVRGALREIWDRGGLCDLTRASGLNLNALEAAILTQELIDRGLVDPKATDELGYPKPLTSAGKAIAQGNTRRFKKAAADKVIAETVARVEAHNSGKDHVQYIDKIWIFGSAIRGEDTVGDVDFAIEKSFRPDLSDSDDAFSQALQELRGKSGKQEYNALQWERDRAIYGARKNPMLSRQEIDDLINMAVPCQLVYDRDRGGPVFDRVLEKHPKASVRDFPERVTTLTLPPASGLPAPMPADWISGFRGDGANTTRLPNTGVDETTFSGVRWGSGTCTKGGSDIDGVNYTLIHATSLNPALGASLILQREIIEEDGELIVRGTIGEMKGDVEALQSRLCETVATLLAADAERLQRYEHEVGLECLVTLDIVTDNETFVQTRGGTAPDLAGRIYDNVVAWHEGDEDAAPFIVTYAKADGRETVAAKTDGGKLWVGR